MAAVQGNLLPSASPLPGEKGPGGEKGEGKGSTWRDGGQVGKVSSTSASTVLSECSGKVRIQEEGPLWCPPPSPSLAAATYGMTLGPFTGGSWRSPVAQSTSVVNLRDGCLFA